jgi:hypothetical protein
MAAAHARLNDRDHPAYIPRPSSWRRAGCSVADVTAEWCVTGWRALELGAPDIARRGRARLSTPRVALLGTLRADSSPRISPVEPCIAEGQLLIGAMAWSGKVADLRRDPRYVLHSSVTDPDSGEGELKLSGAAVEVCEGRRSAATGAWWSAWPPDKAIVFTLGVEQAVFIEWDTEHGIMTVHRWSPRSGYTISRRRYP